jgi:predicted nuclease of predicted toxin-antitoxin system
MRFLVDECTGPAVAQWLRLQNHDVISVYDEIRGADDKEVIQKASEQNWILITNDKDFGELVFREKKRDFLLFSGTIRKTAESAEGRRVK